ncbi:SET domain-containing protein [Dendrothele bispora CBS 962.96]|uniref:SET domain-containing protein n=1 Tax=Dendrothele bispora (strain CBS 962.96) TaxID=1314807 RepID=A0A4S8MJU1_DENBC|nr:SET domain-containing protein [Dendrothele bispora CBS 962.96]
MASLDANLGDRPPELSPYLPADELQSRMEQMKTWLSRQNELSPRPLPPINRFSLVQAQNRRILDAEVDEHQHKIWRTFVGSPKNYSSTPLDKLSPVLISEMLLHKVHKGKFLLCRVVTPMVKMVGVHTVIEDSSGSVLEISIYNFPSTGLGFSCESANALFPVGTIVAIREPTLKLGNRGGQPLIRVDSISDIIFLDQTDPAYSEDRWSFTLPASLSAQSSITCTVEDFKKTGNLHFLRGEWLPAVFAYSKGLRLDKDAFLLRLNRAEAYLRLSYYSAALSDAQTVLSLEFIDSERRWKALTRAGKALYFQGKYAAAKDMFQQCISCKGDRDAKEWVSRIDEREEERLHGRFDWSKIYKQNYESPHILHIADFHGPIEVKALHYRGGGRGVVATADIKVGQLLVVEKPFASVYPSELPENESLLTYNLHTGTVPDSSHTVLITKVIERIWGNPEDHAAVYNLFAGPKCPLLPTKPPKTSSVSRERATEGATPFPFESAVDIDVMHLESILSYNAFCPQEIPEQEERSKKDLPSAFYLFASLFNHSCDSNAEWTCIGDVMVIRAIRPISKGDEIYIAYVPGSRPFLRRRKTLRKHFPREDCPCNLCTEDRADGTANCQQREELVKKMCQTKSIEESRRLLKQIEETYRSSRVLRPEMFKAKQHLAFLIREEFNQNAFRLSGFTLRSRVREAIKLDIDSLESVGIRIGKNRQPVLTQLSSTVSSETLILYFLSIAAGFFGLEDRVLAGGWVKAAESVLKLGLGGDKALFMFLFGNRVEKMGIGEFVYSVLGY